MERQPRHTGGQERGNRAESFIARQGRRQHAGRQQKGQMIQPNHRMANAGGKTLPERFRHRATHRVVRGRGQRQQGRQAQGEKLAAYPSLPKLLPVMLAASGPGCKRHAVGPAGWSLYIHIVIKLLRILLLLGLLLLAGPAFAACADSPAPSVEWRRCLLDGVDLTGRDLTGATLRDTSFARGRFVEAKLAGVDASDARFGFADLSRADLTGATLRSTDLTRAVLAGATLKGADLRRATLFRADLRGADLTGAELAGANFSGAELGGARWLDGQKICAAGSIGSCQ